MKKLILLFSIFTLFASAQIFNPVSWDFSYTQISDTEVDLHFKAAIDDGWYVYSQFTGDGPVPTEFTFENSD
jgi:hypothetical protein